MSDYRDRNDKPKGPSHHAFQVSEGKDGKGYFNRVGAAFPHKDGQGYNVVLDSVPVDGKVTLRTPSERLEAMKDGRSSNRTRDDRGRDDRERG